MAKKGTIHRYPKELQKAKKQLSEASTEVERRFYHYLVEFLNRGCFNKADALVLAKYAAMASMVEDAT